MGLVTMSEHDLQRIEVLTDVLAGRRTVAAAATVLAVSERQMYRLLAKYENGGASGLIHKAPRQNIQPEPERRHPQICCRAGQDSIR
jgi:hypothetical protein